MNDPIPEILQRIIRSNRENQEKLRRIAASPEFAKSSLKFGFLQTQLAQEERLLREISQEMRYSASTETLDPYRHQIPRR